MTLAVLHIGSILRFLELWQGASTIAKLVKQIMFGEIIAFSLVKRMKGNQNYFSEEKIKYKSNSLIGISYRLQGSLYMLLLNTQPSAQESPILSQFSNLTHKLQRPFHSLQF